MLRGVSSEYNDPLVHVCMSAWPAGARSKYGGLSAAASCLRPLVFLQTSACMVQIIMPVSESDEGIRQPFVTCKYADP